MPRTPGRPHTLGAFPFDSQGWIYDLKPYMDTVKYQFIESSLETAAYQD